MSSLLDLVVGSLLPIFFSLSLSTIDFIFAFEAIEKPYSLRKNESTFRSQHKIDLLILWLYLYITRLRLVASILQRSLYMYS